MGVKQLVGLILAGEKGAVAKLYRMLSPSVRRYLQGRLGNENDVEELLQDTFMSLLDSLPLYRGEASVKTFAFSIARHEVADWYRKRYVRKVIEKTAPLFDSMMSEVSTPSFEMKKAKLKKRFYSTYQSMSDKQQDILSYRYELGMSVKEIAEKMEMSVKATESLLYRTRVAFRRVYESTEMGEI